MSIKSALIILFASSFFHLYSQTDTILIEEKSFVEYDGLFSSYSGIFDKNDARYIYSANVELGLIVYKIINDELVEIANFPNSNFNNLQVTNVDQVGDLLYLSLGNFQSILNIDPGIAILNIADPENINIEGLWSSNAFNKGAAIIKVKEDYAYLGMMDSGMAIVNVANPDSMYYVSHIVPDYFFPSTPGLFSKPHTRGMAIRDDFAFLCTDAGGFRVVDISEKEAPTEEAKYVNDYVFQNAGRAYNNILLDGDVAYLTLDYCGLEVVDISDPFAPQPIALLDLWDCGNAPWEDGIGHMNELAKVPGQDILFVSGGDTEIVVFDISTPSALKVIGTYGAYQDSIVAWGLNIAGSHIALFQIDNSGVPDIIPQPYYGEQGGVKLLEWDFITAIKNLDRSDFKVFPNPFSERINIKFQEDIPDNFQAKLYNQLGQILYEETIQNSSLEFISFDFSKYAKGLYYLSLENGTSVYTEKLIKL